MIEGIDGSQILFGARGQPSADIDAFLEVMLSISALANEMDDVVSSIEINPLIILEKGKRRSSLMRLFSDSRSVK